MSWQPLTYLNLTRKQLRIFLAAFSLLTLATIGIIWACADSDDSDYSVFAPEYFVNPQYSPFFYTGNQVYYNQGYGPTANERYNDIITDEWFGYFDHKFSRSSLKYLLITATAGAIDTVYQNYTGTPIPLPKTYPDSIRGNISKKQMQGFFDYLKLAKTCEDYSVNNQYPWGYNDSIKPLHSPADMGATINVAFEKEYDSFIKERLWFQLVRYYYFDADSNAAINTVKAFDKYKNNFPKNLIYYRAMGYVAGYYYHKKNYALANYLYSLCYNYSYDLKIPSFWSFHPQNETDWKTTLQLAKNDEEKITLWQLMGVSFDDGRAIKEIVAINPKSEKLDLLLSRYINENETIVTDYYDKPKNPDSVKQSKKQNKLLIEDIANKNNTAKPYFWNLAAGYLNYMDGNYPATAKYYARAKKQFPKGDTLIAAQGKLLDILLYVSQLTSVTPAAEQKLIEPLNWLADLRDGKIKIPYLRYMYPTVGLAKLYNKQGEYLKAVCFNDTSSFYKDGRQTLALIALLNKPQKTPFERAMLRYYSHTADELYYHLALEKVYNDQPEKAIAILKQEKPKVSEFVLDANPFNSRLIDCHDCDAAAPQKQTFTPVSFLQTLQTMKKEIIAGKNVYRNAYLIAGAYYNITYYGNGRLLYKSDVISSPEDYTYDKDGNKVVSDVYTNMANAAKYYKQALAAATTNEQKARCIFMLSKCAQNDVFSDPNYGSVQIALYAHLDNYQAKVNRYNSYFAELKNKYAKTCYYKEVLNECGYFKTYVNSK